MPEHLSHATFDSVFFLIDFGHNAQRSCSCKSFALASQWCLCNLLYFRSATFEMARVTSLSTHKSSVLH